ncbi:baeRF2 domain-containing protein [Streptomyces sp. 6N223]|uniref:baeRF2 domain-containing protein n=1 Tax=Streptomyces sp. 6N223 TaxID=3457412 RepID=UPI003FD017E1
MKLSFLDPLYAAPGPVAGVYLDTSRDIDDPDHAIELRWRHLSDDLRAQGADDAAVAALASRVGSDRAVPGPHGQALFATYDGRTVLAEELPEPPAHDTARVGEVPDALPLAVQHAPDIAYVAVTVGREHAGHAGHAEDPGDAGEIVATFQTGRWPMSRVAPGPVATRRAPAEDWPRAAARIADDAAELVRRAGAEAIVVGASERDAWARGALVNRLPGRLRDRVVPVGAGAASAGRALLEGELAAVLTGRLSEHDRHQTDLFLAQRARHRTASEGMTAAVAALQRGQAQALLVSRPPRAGDRPMRPLWGGPEPTHIAGSAEELRAFGVTVARERPADALLVRAAAGTSAELVIVPDTEPHMDDGVGVLLRYTVTRQP